MVSRAQSTNGGFVPARTRPCRRVDWHFAGCLAATASATCQAPPRFSMIDLARYSLISLCRGTGWDCLLLALVYQSCRALWRTRVQRSASSLRPGPLIQDRPQRPRMKPGVRRTAPADRSAAACASPPPAPPVRPSMGPQFAQLGAVKMHALDVGTDQKPLRLRTEQQHRSMLGVAPDASPDDRVQRAVERHQPSIGTA